MLQMYAFILKYTSLLPIKRQEIYDEINFLKKSGEKFCRFQKKHYLCTRNRERCTLDAEFSRKQEQKVYFMPSAAENADCPKDKRK